MAKRITAIVSLSVVGVLILACIIMANITVNHRIKCATPDMVYVHTGSVSTSGMQANDAEASEIVKLINSASKERSLTALFKGTINDKAELVTLTTTKKLTSPSSAGYTYFVHYIYKTAQPLKNGNKNVKGSDGKTYYYRELYFGVKNEEGKTKFNVYVIPWFDDNGNENKGGTSYKYYYELNANFSNLYTYLNERSWK